MIMKEIRKEIVCDVCGHVIKEDGLWIPSYINRFKYKRNDGTLFGWVKADVCDDCLAMIREMVEADRKAIAILEK